MFARVPKAPRSTSKLARRTAAPGPSATAIEHAHMLQRSLGNQATLRLLRQRKFDPKDKEVSGDQGYEADPASLTAQVAQPSLPWDSNKNPLYPRNAASRTWLSPRLAMAPLPGAVQAKSVAEPTHHPLERAADRVANQVMGIQMKAGIGPVDDPLERAADHAAERVIAGKLAGAIHAPSCGAGCKCSGCKAEEEHIRRQEQGPAAGTVGGARAEAAVHAVSFGGMPLSARQRAYFEPRFGQDFSNVRLHTDAQAAAAANDIHARAYTWHDHIAFATGEFSPGSREGLRLIAHELAHVAQQVPHIARQAAPPFYTRTFRDEQGGDPLDYTETVQAAPTQAGTGIEGSVDRSVSVPASGAQPAQVTHRGRVNHIRLTPDCRLVVPYRIQFQQQQAAAAPGICQVPPNATPVNPLPAAQLQAIQTRYINSMNAGLNNRYAARVTGCRTAQPCTDKPVPVVVVAQAVTNNPDRTINIVNRGGRANAATVCAGSFQDELAVHEGGHQALGAPDEYQETNPAVIAAAAAVGLNWGRPERVRSDLSAMEDEYSYGRFMMFHERHFRFAQVFLEAVLRGQGCSVGLEPVSSSPWEFRLDTSFGSVSSNRGGLAYGSLFLGAGIPLNRRRRLSLLLGAQGEAFGPTLGVQDQTALMAGLRLGLEAQTTPARFGLNANVFATGGGLYAPASRPDPLSGLTAAGSRFSPYGEAGASLSLHFPMASSFQLRVGGEAALGREFSSDPHALNWWRLGFVIGISR